MYIGIDLGGTNIAVGAVSDGGEILTKASMPTLSGRGYKKIVKDMALLCKKVTEQAGGSMADVRAIGIGSPGTIDSENGIVVFAGNLKMEKVPVAEELRKYFDVPIHMENDANAAAYGEYKAGALKGAQNAVAITLGTGIGSGIIIDGKIYAGNNYAAGEMGHMVIVYDGRQCNCGRKGCWERYASATGLIITTKESMEQNKDSVMWELCGGDINKASGRTAFDAMRKGDEAGKQVVDHFINYLGCGLVNVINTFQPDILCIGGGICNEGETLLAPVRTYVDNEQYAMNAKLKTKICRAELGNDAGIIGAALLGE